MTPSPSGGQTSGLTSRPEDPFTIGRTFPLLRGCEGRVPLSFDPDLLLPLFVSHMERMTFVREIGEALLSSQGGVQIGAAWPGIYRILELGLPFEQFGTRAANVFRELPPQVTR